MTWFRYKGKTRRTAQQPATILQRLTQRLRSFEFWLGLTAGLTVRMATKFAIEAAFGPSHRQSAALVGAIASAGAGLMAGIAVHMTRIFYGNLHLPKAKREAYFSVAMLESAVTGLFGGILGGCVSQVGSLLAETSGVAVAAASGVTIGAVNAAVHGGNANGGRRSTGDWARQLLQGAVFGVTGGLLGVMAFESLHVVQAEAASLSDMNYGHAAQNAESPCGADLCITVPTDAPPPGTGPIHSVGISQSVADIAPPSMETPMPAAPAELPNTYRTYDAVHCRWVVHTRCEAPVHHHHHHKAHPHHKPSVEVFKMPPEPPIVIEHYIQAPPPPPVQLPPVVIHNSCDTDCDTPCDDGSGQGYPAQGGQVIMQGGQVQGEGYGNPSAMPPQGVTEVPITQGLNVSQNTVSQPDAQVASNQGQGTAVYADNSTYVERVNFDSNGDAAGPVVLEKVPAGNLVVGTHFEQAAQAVTGDNDNQAQPQRVSMVVPVRGDALNLAA